MRIGPSILALLLISAQGGGVALAQASDNADSGGGRTGPGTLIISRPQAGYGTGLNLSILGGLGSYGNDFGIGVGGLFAIPIVRQGFIRPLNDSFHLEFGMFTNLGFTRFRGTGIYLSPLVGVRWDFHILQSFTAYAHLRTGVAIGVDVYNSGFYIDGGVGGFWRFSKPVALRFEFTGGYVGAGVNAGVAFFFQ